MKKIIQNISIVGFKSFVIGLCFGLGIYTMDVIAVTITGTMNTFFTGQIVKASEVNTNFTSLRTAIESIPDWTKSGVNAVLAGGGLIIGTSSLANSSSLTVNGRISSSSLGVYCGVTSLQYTGLTVGGYTGAKSKCETACGNTNAHMCTSHELAISRQLSISITGSSWYSSHSYWDGAEPTVLITDCDGWTSNSGSIGGSYNNPSSTHASWNYCNLSFPIACCL